MGLAAAFALTPDEHSEFTRKIDTGALRVPSRWTLQRAAVKLDYLSLLYQRRLFKDALASNEEWVSQFGGDSSPQVTFDYMNCVEERFVLAGGPEATALRCKTLGLVKGLGHIRRTLVCQALGLGEASGAAKFRSFVKALAYETDSEDMVKRRNTASCWFADQGVDLAVGDCPNARRDDLAELVKRLADGSINFSADAARDVFFLPLAVTTPQFMHGVFGLLREALEGAEAWKAFQPVLSEIVVVLGNKMFRDRLIALCMQKAEKHERQQLHGFEGHRFDWRWEVLEVLLDQLCDIWPTLKKYFDFEVMSRGGELTGIKMEHLSRALANKPDDLPGIECMA